MPTSMGVPTTIIGRKVLQRDGRAGAPRLPSVVELRCVMVSALWLSREVGVVVSFRLV